MSLPLVRCVSSILFLLLLHRVPFCKVCLCKSIHIYTFKPKRILLISINFQSSLFVGYGAGALFGRFPFCGVIYFTSSQDAAKSLPHSYDIMTKMMMMMTMTKMMLMMMMMMMMTKMMKMMMTIIYHIQPRCHQKVSLAIHEPLS